MSTATSSTHDADTSVLQRRRRSTMTDREDATEPDRGREAAAPVLTLSGVSKTFGGVAALRDISFDLYPGEVHALVGMNGAGKSTLVGVLSGAHVPDTGVIALDGKPLSGLSP